MNDQLARTATPLPTAVKNAVDDQVDRFLAGLLTEDIQSEAFRAKLDSAFALGREEASVAPT